MSTTLVVLPGHTTDKRTKETCTRLASRASQVSILSDLHTKQAFVTAFRTIPTQARVVVVVDDPSTQPRTATAKRQSDKKSNKRTPKRRTPDKRRPDKQKNKPQQPQQPQPQPRHTAQPTNLPNPTERRNTQHATQLTQPTQPNPTQHNTRRSDGRSVKQTMKGKERNKRSNEVKTNERTKDEGTFTQLITHSLTLTHSHSLTSQPLSASTTNSLSLTHSLRQGQALFCWRSRPHSPPTHSHRESLTHPRTDSE